MQELDGLTAFGQTLRNGARRFPDRKDRRYAGQMLMPEVTPGFALAPGDQVFTIGSCFARNVEDALVARGLQVPTAAFSAPQEEAPGRPNRMLNQYNPGTMLQCLRDIETGETGDGLYAQGEQVIDCLLATGSRPVGPERAFARRAEIRDLYARGLAQATTVVVTLGLIESWYDRFTGTYLNEAPTRKILNAEPERFSFRQLEVGECRDMVLELLDRLVDGGNRCVVLTVSPVPLQVTFAGGDAALRNAYSKATLRVVAEEAARQFAEVDYFPSYEMVMSLGLSGFGEDNVHVRPAVVDRIIGHMTDLYVQPGPIEGVA
ncbi:GSCFA family protein [Pseudooceanicola antarcticus]|uniref:GSCFA family protein n=1 Tax=Pseudooceanicola antarcticus TaxID=1247613 RepID=A0A285ITF4_9RHOB|nr:GSCFA domain-containing protein [Pseudooceanicola antarcticus]PJE32020.1 hypothetical protein CVM39_02690 [Pseudooceanicola antarcticus]SNY51268.1 GSCFA family protein [Pseudooceanicola antarcticus]